MSADDEVAQAPSALRLSRVLPAPREAVFAAFSRAEALRQWLCPTGFTCPDAETDFRVGGRYRVDMRSPEGKVSRVGGVYRAIQPPARLVFTWGWEPDHELAGIETVVTVELEDRGGRTALVMTHTGLPSDTARDQHAWGWNGALDNLALLLERPRPAGTRP